MKSQKIVAIVATVVFVIGVLYCGFAMGNRIGDLEENKSALVTTVNSQNEAIVALVDKLSEASDAFQEQKIVNDVVLAELDRLNNVKPVEQIVPDTIGSNGSHMDENN